METIEHKIGDTFCLEDGTKLEVVEESSCEGCYFYNNMCISPEKKCSSITRKDENSVIFKQIKDNNMKEKRNIQISLEEAKEWYNSGDSFKKELALKAYKKEELIDLGFCDILSKMDYYTDKRNKIKEKAIMYEKLLIVATYLNSIYEKEYHDRVRLYFYIKPKNQIILTKGFKYKSFTIADTIIKGNYPVYFNSSKAAKKAIDILGEELNVLFE